MNQATQSSSGMPYSAPAMIVAGSVGQLTGGPITVNSESYGFQAA